MLPTRAVVLVREQSFRDAVILTARAVLEDGYRKLVPLQSKGYTHNLTEAKAKVVKHNLHYSLKEQLIFQEAARLTLREVTEFHNLEVFGNVTDQPKEGQRLVQLFIRQKRS